MFHLRYYLIIVCSVSLLLTSCGSKKTAEVIKAESQKSVALISHLKGHGVGFFIEGAAGVCTVLTAKHVVPDGKDISILTMKSKLPFKPLNIRRADNVDLAVLTFKPLDGNCPFPALKLGDSKDVVLAQPIYISSYPGGADGQAPKQSFYISSVTDKTPGGADGYELGYKTDTLGGTSGSPVLNEFGEVIAVHGRSYMNKDSNLLVNDRAYLDLAILINIYKQDKIAKVEMHKIREIGSSISPVVGLISRSNSGWFALVICVGACLVPLSIALGATRDKLHVGIIIAIPIFVLIGIFSDNNRKFKTQTITNYDELIRQNPNYTDAYFYRAQAKLEAGKKEDAVNDYAKVIELNPNDGAAYLGKCMIELSLGREKEAITDYNRGIELEPKAPERWDFYITKAVIDYNSGKKEKAIADYDKAIEFLPNTAYLHRARAGIELELGKEKDAIADYNKAIELEPDSSYQYYNRGRAKSKLGDKQGAITDYQKAAELYLKEGNHKSYQNILYLIKKLKA
jgi:tetratricopeptide (TPR) repeat protein